MGLSSSRIIASPDRWLAPRRPLDPTVRLHTYGKVRPMDYDEDRPFLWRLFHRA